MSEPRESAAARARQVVAEAGFAALATLEPEGAPYASLVAVAPDLEGRPLLLLSTLARHTRNLTADSRVSLLFAGPRGEDPLNAPRVSLLGEIAVVAAEEAKATYLARHPLASGYADFTDFSFYRMDVREAHLVGGFGRIVTLPGADVGVDWTGAEALKGAVDGIVSHMNEDHLDAIQGYAHRLLKETGTDWRMLSIDPEGTTLIREDRTRRLDFPGRITSAGEARKMLVALVRGGD
ncbi:pyridoxamine 5'-phosphate oxidase family protein [Aquabacter sp. L1I39]|uniref:HugZ family pyridoxamine 5'-phosphate oxidase n=1 Tax=Aquabacter sp. L1I39 TaxID=2820278 RepID=UPI001ADBA83F|nr:DUF2470 domain-containing protein [Aquabacter sp. L1I39]QTL04357.1 pyridoxamine 5'-phosphate oxidase family protein [Aquabacter sp. L1I39]